MANVQSTISTLQELSDLTKKLCHGFEEDAIEMQREVQDQLEGFGGFNTQKSRIESLEWRLKSSQETTATLTDRLDAAHERLRVLETQEAEVQATISCKLEYLSVRLLVISANVSSRSAIANILGHSGRCLSYSASSFDIAQFHTANGLYGHGTIHN